jgi:RNA polymerase sigma-54 factor
MAMKPSLQLKLSQHLALTPQLQQSIRLLQLSTLELNQEIEQAIAENPLLEREDDPLATTMRVASDGAIVERSAAGEASMIEPGGQQITEANGTDHSEDLGEIGVADWGSASSAASSDDEDASPLTWALSHSSLAQHLTAQLAATQASPRDRVLVGLLIEALDEDGYLTSTLEEVLEMCPPEAELELDDLTAALKLLQSFDPPGIGARNPSECLLIQLELLGRQTQVPCSEQVLMLAKAIVSEHLPLLASHDFAKLRRLLDASEDDLRTAHQVIRGLNPRPGVAFGAQATDYVLPDIFVRRIKGRWTAQLNPEIMPRLRVNQLYASILKRDRGKEGQAPWSARLQEARWLIRNIQQRFDTILRVAQAIVDRQHNFFTHGAIAMRPLVLREIANTVSLHESTISRVTASKYMSTPFGVFELKYFFGSHVATETGGAASSTAIRALIKQLIGAEDPKEPLSDSRIAELLGEQGIVVARRTVAKYREALKIPPVAMRKAL